MSEPRVYVLHGLLGTAYGHFGAQLRDWRRRLRVVPVDLPGHGRCRVDAGDRYLELAGAYLTTVVERFGPGRLVAASYLGGPVAVRLALARPELVESLVLTGFVPDVPRDVFLRWLAGFGLLAREQPRLRAEYERLHGNRWPDTLAAYTAEVETAYAERVLVRAEHLDALPRGLLVANGSVKTAERTAAEQAGARGGRVRGLVIEGAGHIASHDAPAAFTAAVDAFWKEEHADDGAAGRGAA